MFSGALESPSRPCNAEHSTALDTGHTHTGPTANGLFRYTMEDATSKPLSVPKPSRSTSTGDPGGKGPRCGDVSLPHQVPLSHCPWTDFTVQNKTTDSKDPVGPSCSSWHPLESRGPVCDLCAQTKSNELRKQVPRMGFMNGSPKPRLQMELARNAAQRNKAKPWTIWTHCAGADLEQGGVLQRAGDQSWPRRYWQDVGEILLTRPGHLSLSKAWRLHKTMWGVILECRAGESPTPASAGRT